MKAVLLLSVSAVEIFQFTQDNFESASDVIKEKDGIVWVRFYDSTCGLACKEQDAKFRHIADEFNSEEATFFAQIDCSADRHLCSRVQVSSFPAIALYDPVAFTVDQYQSSTQQMSSTSLRFFAKYRYHLEDYIDGEGDEEEEEDEYVDANDIAAAMKELFDLLVDQPVVDTVRGSSAMVYPSAKPIRLKSEPIPLPDDNCYGESLPKISTKWDKMGELFWNTLYWLDSWVSGLSG